MTSGSKEPDIAQSPAAMSALAEAAPPGRAWRFPDVAEPSPIGVAVLCTEGRFRHVNAVCCAICDCQQDELLGRPFTTFFRVEQQQAALARHQQFLDGIGHPEDDWQIVRADGTICDVFALSRRLQNEDGRPCRVVYLLDVTTRRRAERALLASQRFAHAVLDSLGSPICVIDQDGTIMAINQAWREFAEANGGRPGTVFEGASYLAACEAAVQSAMDDAGDAGRFLVQLRELLAGGCSRFEFEYPCHAPDEKRWYSARLSRIEDSDPPRFVVAHISVTALKLAEASLQRQAMSDELTGISNRRHLVEALKMEFERVRRHRHLQSSVLAIDVDHFKQVNDTHGHAAGDAVLVHITRLFNAQIRPIDVVGRTGGEEFAILLPDTDAASAMVLGQRLGQFIASQPLEFAGQHIRATVSIGVTLLAATDDTVDAALSRADQALYAAKTSGRNTICLLLPPA